MGEDTAWVSVSSEHDTSQFAAESLRRWWYAMGRAVYPEARQLLVICDGGGSNGSRTRLWKWELQPLADETGRHVQSELDSNPYPSGCRSSDRQMQELRIERHEFHGARNFTLLPRNVTP
ncbi:MAG: hypothetical protein H0U67_12775 [Gemmatimonadetes bacterium]|nr:hypothetical protein [Gemmatimonadota bacterium]